MNFQDWLNLDEARGAFGNDRSRMQRSSYPTTSYNIKNPIPKEANPEPTTRFNNRFQRFDQRVEYGKSIEDQIFSSLQNCGMELQKASQKQDMYDKIDGWWIKDGQKFPIQIKYRDTGDDILFEVMKDYRLGTPGRDMVGKAQYYAVMNRSKIINVVAVAEAKKLINSAIGQLQQHGFDQRGNFDARIGRGVVSLKLREDPGNMGVGEKLMAYLPLAMLNPVISSCKATVNF